MMSTNLPPETPQPERLPGIGDDLPMGPEVNDPGTPDPGPEGIPGGGEGSPIPMPGDPLNLDR